MSIAAWVATRRKELHLSRRYMSDNTEILNGRVYAIEHGMGRPVSVEELADLEKILGPYPDGTELTTQGDGPHAAPAQPEPAPEPGGERIDGTPIQSTGGIDWSTLQAKAKTVSPHQLERAEAFGLPLMGPDPSGGFRLISHSEGKTFEECQRRWWLAWYRGLRLRQQSPLGALAIGDRIHRALRMWYTPDGVIPTDPRIALERCITDDWTALVKTYGENSPEIERVSKDFNAEANLERAMISGYVDWLSETGADSELAVIAAETYMEAVLELPAGYPDTKIIGKLDVRFFRKIDGARLFMDHKTVGDLVTPTRTLRIDTQMKHYHLLEFLTTDDADRRCNAALYNMLRKVKRTATAKPPFYGRAEVDHNPHTIENYHRHVIATTVKIIDTERALESGMDHHDVVTPTPSKDCHWKCPFVAVCSMLDDGSRAEAMLEQFYVKGEPLSYYMKDMDPSVDL